MPVLPEHRRQLHATARKSNSREADHESEKPAQIRDSVASITASALAAKIAKRKGEHFAPITSTDVLKVVHAIGKQSATVKEKQGVYLITVALPCERKRVQILFRMNASVVGALVYFIQQRPSQLTPLIAKACLYANDRTMEKRLQALTDDGIEIHVVNGSIHTTTQPGLSVKGNCIRLG